MARFGRAQPAPPFVGRVPFAVGRLPIDAVGYEIGDGNSPGSMAIEAGVDFDVAVYPIAQWPLSAPSLTANGLTTNGSGRLADILSAAFSAGSTYRVLIRRTSDGEIWTFTIAAV